MNFIKQVTLSSCAMNVYYMVCLHVENLKKGSDKMSAGYKEMSERNLGMNGDILKRA